MAMPRDLVTFLEHGDVCLLFDTDETLVKLAGEIDLTLAESLDFVVGEAMVRDCTVRLDVSRVTFMDSTGVSAVARLGAAELEAGRRMRVEGATRPLRELFEVSGLSQVLDVAG